MLAPCLRQGRNRHKECAIRSNLKVCNFATSQVRKRIFVNSRVFPKIVDTF